MSKTIENIVHDRLYMYLEKSFNKSRLKNACDKNLYTGIYLDHQKAFYRVNQNILLENLKHYGIKVSVFVGLSLLYGIGFNTLP